MGLRVLQDGQELYSASRYPRATFTITDDCNEIVVEKFVLDTIKAVASAYTDADKPRENLGEFIQLMFLSNVQEIEPGEPDKTILERLIRILIADQNDESERATSAFLAGHASHETVEACITSLVDCYTEDLGLFELRV